ncbi:CoA ester lyase [Amycolatopsis sp.]|uniref:HpcH/HpaI aldolase/citrate lyase family protein n=1 Tax=Amycolatopsis sp. TaxID=37632 RepID=UPI002D7E51F1|nr:CoA ester lyase [Amycolatopsis sp.]HET6706131.1 CoA ester lyase [Amycolatopsis sp.]
MTYSRYCRSVLATPAPMTSRYTRAHTSGADMCVVDLEDSVAPHQKAEARRVAEKFFEPDPAVGDDRPLLAIRINAVSTRDGLRDLLAVVGYAHKPDVVVIPMVESPRDIEIVEQVLGDEYTETDLFAIVETPRGIDRIESIAHASPRLKTLSFGQADYAFAIGARLRWDTLAHVRSRMVNSAHAAGLYVVDSPLFELADPVRLREESVLARDFGFHGKTAIHPGQVPVINQAFSPDEDTLAHARRVVEAGEATGFGIGKVDGAMVGAPFFEASRRMLAEFGDEPGGPA